MAEFNEVRQDAFPTHATHEELPADLAALRALLQQARETLAQQQARFDAQESRIKEQAALLDTQRETIKSLELRHDRDRAEIETSEARVRKSNQHRFGRRSENDDRLDRQQDLFAPLGWTPSRSTLCNLTAAVDELMMPIAEHDDRGKRCREVIAAAIESGKPSITARMWGYQSPTKPLVFSTSLRAAIAVAPFSLLVTNCYAGFEAITLASDSRITRAA